MSGQTAGSFQAIVNLISYGASTASEMLAYRDTNKVYQEVVDYYSQPTWTRVLKTADIRKAFDEGNAYVVDQAYFALGWWQGSHDVEETNDKGIVVKRKKPNSELIRGIPDVAGYPFANSFVKNSYPTIDDFILREDLMDVRGEYGRTPLIYSVLAAIIGVPRMLERARRLIEMGANVDLQDDDGMTALMAACTSERTNEIAKLLIRMGADVNIRDKQWATYISQHGNVYTMKGGRTAIFYGMTFTIHYPFLAKLLTVAPFSSNGEPKLHGNVLSEVIAAGADLDVKDDAGDTPLIVSIKAHLGIATMKFVRAGANVNLHDGSGDYPAKILLTQRSAYFRPSSKPEDTERHLDGINRTMQMFTEHGLDLTNVDTEGNTVFMFVKTTAIMRTLIDYARHTNMLHVLNFQNYSGQTALHVVVQGYNAEYPCRPEDRKKESQCGYVNFTETMNIVRRLLEAGARANIPDNNGHIPKSRDLGIQAFLDGKWQNKRP